MHNDLVMQSVMSVVRCVVVLVSHKNLLRSLAAFMLITAAALLTQPVSAQAGDLSGSWTSPEQMMSLLNERLRLTEEQETRVKSLIDETFKKRSEIIKNGGRDGKSEKSALRELQWSTDMQIGQILTDDQMKEYQELREEESEHPQHSDTRRGRGMHAGGLRGF